MTEIRDEFLSEEDLDLRNMTQEELITYWNAWLEQAQTTNDRDNTTIRTVFSLKNRGWRLRNRESPPP